MKFWRAVLGTGASALAVTCALPPVGLWWLACIAWIPWLAVCRRPLALVVGGVGWGTLSGVGIGYWVYGGLRNLGAEPAEAFTGLVIVVLGVTGIPGGLFGVAAAIARRWSTWGSLVFASVVAGIDALRALPHLGLPWGLLGHSQSPAGGVAQLAVVGGVPAVSALLAGLSYAAAESLRHGGEHDRSQGPRLTWLPWLASYLALLGVGLPVARAFEGPVATDAGAKRLLAIQNRIAPRERWLYSAQARNLAALGRQTHEAVSSMEKPPDLVVWPETALTVPLEADARVASALREGLARIDTPLVLGGVSATGSDALYRNSAIWLDATATPRDRFDKTLAVPFVERGPTSWLERTVQAAMGADSTYRLVVEGSEQRPLRGDDAYAIALCFEILYPGLVSRRLDSQTVAILNLANDSWYGSATPGEQQLAFGTFRAIENRRPLLRVADSGPSAVVDRFGRIVRQLEPGATGSIVAEIGAAGDPSLDERIAILAVAASGAGFGCVVRRFGRRQNR